MHTCYTLSIEKNGTIIINTKQHIYVNNLNHGVCWCWTPVSIKWHQDNPTMSLVSTCLFICEYRLYFPLGLGTMPMSQCCKVNLIMYVFSNCSSFNWFMDLTWHNYNRFIFIFLIRFSEKKERFNFIFMNVFQCIIFSFHISNKCK